jgi:hypothetical protein
MPRRYAILMSSRAHAPTRGFDQDRGWDVMSTAIGDHRNLDSLEAARTPYPHKHMIHWYWKDNLIAKHGVCWKQEGSCYENPQDGVCFNYPN